MAAMNETRLGACVPFCSLAGELVPRWGEAMRWNASWAWAGAALGATLATAAPRDEAEAEIEAEIEQVIVSAGRLGAADHRAFVLENDDLASAIHATEALRLLPGVAVSGANRGALAQLRVRGAEANHLLVLLDGVPINDPAAGAAFNFGLLDLAGVERLEFQSGPLSAIWGADALAGVLYLDTRPTASDQRFAFGYGTHATADADLRFAHRGQRHHAALAAGWAESAGANAAREGDEADGYAHATGNLQLGTRVGAWQLAANAHWLDAEVEFDPSPPPRYVPQDGDRRTEDRQTVLQASARYLGHAHVTPWLTFASLRTTMRNFADQALTNTWGGQRDLARAAANVLWGETAATGAAKHGLNLLVELERERFAQTGAASPFGDPNQRQRMTTASVAGEYQLRLPRLSLSASLRRERNDAFANALAYRLGAASEGRVRFFASLGRSVANPTFTERFGYTPDTFVGNPHLRPETARSLEAGIECRRRTGSVALAVFESNLRREIDGFALDPAIGGFTARNLPGRSLRRGAELRFEAGQARWRLRGSYAYVDAEAGDGGRELRRPRHLANVSLRAELSPRWSASVAVAHAGSSADRDFAAFPARPVTLDAFRTVRADASYEFQRGWRLRLIVDNALDADATTVYGYNAPGPSALIKFEIGE